MFNEGHQSQGYKLGSIAGTTIWVRPSFFILMALFVFLDLDNGVPTVHALLWIPVLLLSVLLHELAHAATIAGLGYGPSTIELGGWGGQTMNARRSKPWHEILVSVAGPASSLLLGGISLMLFIATHDRLSPEMFVLVRLMLWANLAWGVFNLLPIYPLDGGQVLFNALSHFTPRHTALGATTILSVGLALVLGLGALWAGQFFVAIVVASLVMQNWQTWKALRTIRSEMNENPGSSARDTLA